MYDVTVCKNKKKSVAYFQSTKKPGTDKNRLASKLHDYLSGYSLGTVRNWAKTIK